MIVTDLFESTTGSSEDTAKQVYQHMIRKIPEFMYTAPTADVKKAIAKAMAFGPQISVPDLATYAYGILKTKDLDEAYAINEGDVSTSNLRTMYDLARTAKNYCDAEGQESLSELLRILKWYMDQHDSDAINEGEVSTGNLRTMYDLARMAKNYCDAEGQESLSELLRILKWYKDQAEQGVTESSEDNPVANAITRRILMQRTDLLAKYGPVKVMNAIDDIADFVGDVEEIGSSDVSGWIRQIEQSLQSMNTELTEFAPSSDDGNDGFSDETLKRLAAQWWNGDEDPRVEQTLMSAGWEIGQDEGYDEGGVFVVQAGDDNGNSYISWPATELESLVEGWKSALGAAALAGTMAMGAGGASARVMPGDDPGINRLTGKPIATQQATDTAPAKAEAPQGFSKEYLQKAANPDRFGRYLISIEKAQELLKQMNEGVAEGSENNNTTAQKIFFARSNKTPKGWSYDHVGFITQDGKQIQMSGHKGNDVYVTNDVTDDPEFPKQNIKIVSLSKPVLVPTTNSVGAENCGTFVANVLQANGIKGIDTQKIYSVFKKSQEQGVAEGWRDLFRSKSAAAAPGPTGSRSLSPTFSALIPNPATNKPYTNAELRALAGQTATSPIDATAKKRTGGKKSGEVSMTPNAIRKREARKSVTTAVAPAPNPFGQMVNQLQNYKTSTGGQVRGTATGLKHTASPDNPNAVSTAADNTSNPFGKIANQLQNYKTSTGGQVRGTATGLRNTAKSDDSTAMPAAAPVATLQPVATPAATTRKKRTPKTTAAAPAARPNFAPQNAGYKSVSYAPNVKTGASMPKPFGVSAPTARSATKVTSGGPTSDEKAKLARRIAQAVKEPVAEMLQMVETKEDVQRIKKFIDDTFVKHGAVNESAFALRNRILEHVTQVGAQRRRDFAARQTH